MPFDPARRGWTGWPVSLKASRARPDTPLMRSAAKPADDEAPKSFGPVIARRDGAATEDESPVPMTGVVERIEGGFARVLVGPEREPWDFPLEMLPDEVGTDAVLILERRGRRLRFIELDPVTEVVRGRPFDLRWQRTAKKLPYMTISSDT
jgi:hypothetical protein